MIKKIYAIEKKRIVDVFIFISISTYLAHYILKYHLGYLENYWLFFHDQTDHFADTLKIIFSFTNIFTERELLNLNVPELWIYSNPYSELLYGSITPTMSLPPLTIIFLTISAHLAKFIGFDYRSILVIYTLLLIVLIIKIFAKQLKQNKKLIFILFSFPFLFLLDRANLMAAISGLCLFYLFRNFILNKELNNYDLLAFLIACSMRPNYLIFGILFLFKKNNKLNILEFFKVGISFCISNALLFFIAPNFLKDYSLDNFILMVRRYAESSAKFSPWNSSLYGSLNNLYTSNLDLIRSINSKSIGDLIHRLIFNPNLNNYIIIFYLSILFFSFWKIKKDRINKISFLIILCSITALATSPFADYHLVIFIFLFLLVYDLDSNFQENSMSLLLISIVLLPKFHSFSPNIITELNISNFINSTMLNLLIIINLLSKNLKTLDTS